MPVPGTILDLALTQGEDRIFQDTIFQADGITPQNISGWSLAFTLEAYGDPSTVYLTKTTTNAGIVIQTPSAGILNVYFFAADTNALNPGQYQFTIARTDAGNNGIPTRGLFTILPR